MRDFFRYTKVCVSSFHGISTGTKATPRESCAPFYDFIPFLLVKIWPGIHSNHMASFFSMHELVLISLALGLSSSPQCVAVFPWEALPTKLKSFYLQDKWSYRLLLMVVWVAA